MQCERANHHVAFNCPIFLWWIILAFSAYLHLHFMHNYYNVFLPVYNFDKSTDHLMSLQWPSPHSILASLLNSMYFSKDKDLSALHCSEKPESTTTSLSVIIKLLKTFKLQRWDQTMTEREYAGQRMTRSGQKSDFTLPHFFITTCSACHGTRRLTLAQREFNHNMALLGILCADVSFAGFTVGLRWFRQ